MSAEDLPKKLICLHSGRSYEKRIVVLPKEFLEEYGGKIPESVYLHVPSGGIWRGDIVSEKSVMSIETMRNGNESIFKTSKVELEKLAISFNFNSKHMTRNAWEVKLAKKHVEKKVFYQVLSNEGVRKLQIDESLSYIHVGFLSCWWNIDLVKDNGYFSFGKVWKEFVNECNLSEGDVCIFLSTEMRNRLQVVIFKNKEISEWSPPIGEELEKSRSIFLHISSEESLQNRKIVLPRVFMEKYGSQLGTFVKLWMVDRRVWIAAFCKTDNCIFGLQRLQNYYSLEPECLMVFQYFGNCTFYLSIFGSNGMDLLNGIRRKLEVKDVVMERNEGRYAEKDNCNEACNIEDDDSDASGDSLAEVLGAENSENSCESFSVALSLSHFDEKSHGVYIPRSQKRFHSTWRKEKNVTLCYQGKRWEVKGNAAGKLCSSQRMF
ncbi:hypothetical protein POM88_022994 [Heracleum sosnowskyi]|uniref:TF-B3 domain-containing protein n=1 Tax=Heracleum sosnowskyi TaxID=360622 RepID=A0AAD8IHT5_9APIA|nr:hypothetical protein POM88_022994 [Heracleum sosnowskyi]